MWSVIVQYLKLILVDHLMQERTVNCGPVRKQFVRDTDGKLMCIEWCLVPALEVIDFSVVLVSAVYEEGRLSKLSPEIIRIEFVPHTTKMINPFHIQHQAAHCELG